MKAPASKNELNALFEDIFVSPELYLQSFDIAGNAMTFTPMTQETYRSTSFLDERIHRAQSMDAKVDLNGFIGTFDNVRPAPKPLGFIFHTGYCCSTLLARCIQELENTLVLKEPDPLRILSEGWFESTNAQTYRKMGDVLGVLLSRSFGDEAVVVKATSVCNNLMPELLEMHEKTRAIFIFSSLEESIASFLKSPARREEARVFLSRMKNLFPRDLSIEDCQRLIDANVVALLWLLQVELYCQLASTRFSGRLAALNCNQLLADPVAALLLVAKHLGIESSRSAVEDVVSGSAFALHAKEQNLGFSREDRRTDFQRLTEIYGEEIRFATQWAGRLPMWNSIPSRLPAELIVDPNALNMP